ncbi:tRNA pseudouridine(55) synthase [Tremella mesenterica]|uniref:tRNA pseudouridine(55) synthase n=1 Tax=Tremella mesenterica TaxID=5217 RepID=A0A4Q1BTH7_TREME|nr:tRNA pseudouridine(55) synthase [Tremella mesenterica]
MPKAPSNPPLPLNGLFPIAKPSGPTSMKVIDAITPLLLESRLFDDPERRKHGMSTQKRKRKKNTTHMGLKIGQGGTLDPLADGVLVIGVNRGTKHLNRFLECTKEYTSTGLLGAATTTYDAEGEILTTSKWDHITREDVEKAIEKFQGEIIQTPPIFSALKMDGKPLYEYARSSLPLPRAIPTRKCTVHVELLSFTPSSVTPNDGGHNYRWPTTHLSSEQKTIFQRLTTLVHQAQEKEHLAEPPIPDLNLQADITSEVLEDGRRPPTFEIKMTVSSGTYVRSIINDIGLLLGCGAHVVKLTRTRQGEFTLYDEVPSNGAKPSGVTDKNDGVTDGNDSQKVETSQEEKQEISGVKEEKLDHDVSVKKEEESSNDVGVKKEDESSENTTACIPWEVWERAIESRKQRGGKMKKEEEVDEEAMANGEVEEELKEWEKEVLRRFVPVPVPISGTNSRDGPLMRYP